MKQAIVIYANCHNPTAKGDFAFAGSIAKDLVRELLHHGLGMDVFLVSTSDGLPRFENLYGSPVDGTIDIEGQSVKLCSLEKFDAVSYKVVAFIEANRCKYAAADLVKRIVSPDSKFLFIGNINQYALSDLFKQAMYQLQVAKDQPQLYDFFDSRDMFVGSAGPGKNRLGFTAITKAEDLSPLSSRDAALIPSNHYGFMYAANVDASKDYKLITQYMKLTGFSEYVLVGDFMGKNAAIRYTFENDLSFTSPQKSFPQITYHQSLKNGVMRKMAAQATSELVLSTGSLSTLEVLQDGKLPFYQRYDSFTVNDEFVASWAIAVKSIVTNDSSLFGAMPKMILDLSELLFAHKPLSRIDMEKTHDLLQMSSVKSRLTAINKQIMDSANGKIAPRLLSFIGEKKNTQVHTQLATVCMSLRKAGEISSPVYDQALRRAAAWGRLFELKVLMETMSFSQLNTQDPVSKKTAIHWAAKCKSHDCARALIEAGAMVDVQDASGRTPLHEAVLNADKPMIELLIVSGASLTISDNHSACPIDCTSDQGLKLFINDCQKPTVRSVTDAYK